MALTKPILLPVSAFDKSDSHRFVFNVIGGSQVTKNTLTILNNSTLQQVYQQTATTFAFEHTVSADTLTNGTAYQATIQTQDALGNLSPVSEPIIFYCFSAPAIYFSNLPTGNIIANSSYSFEITYEQDELEPLSSYIFNLYNTEDELISTSGTKYTDGTYAGSQAFEFLFSGFEDNTEYKIECKAVTKYGTQISTNRVLINVSYSRPTAFTTFELTNNCDGGYVFIKSNLSNIEGNVVPPPPIYITEGGNTLIDLSDQKYVYWDRNFEFPDNWWIQLWVHNLNLPEDVMNGTPSYEGTFPFFCLKSDNDAEIKLYAELDTDLNASQEITAFEGRLVLEVKNAGNEYGYIIKRDISSDEIGLQFSTRVTYIDGLYEIEVGGYA